MKESKIFDVTSDIQLTALINDLHRYYKVTDIQYSIYYKTIPKKEPEIHYTALVTYCKEDII